MVGVRVTAGYSYSWRALQTNANGYFVSPERWTYSVKYKAHWDAGDFLMEDDDSWNGADLITDGPTSYSAWNRTFVSEVAAYATIFMVAYNYYFGAIDGLNRPKKNGWLNFALDLQISNKDDGSFGSHAVVLWLANWVVIRTRDIINGTSQYRASEDLFATTTPELAHSSHYCSFQTRYSWVPREFEWRNYIGGDIQETYARVPNGG